MGQAIRSKLTVSRGWLLALMGYVGLGALLLLWPNGWTLNRLNVRVYSLMRHYGGPRWMTPEDVAVVLNVLVFMPAGALLALTLPLLRWWHIALIGFGVSLSAELAQWILLPGRSPELIDLATNTLGAALGGLIVAAFRARSPRKTQ